MGYKNTEQINAYIATLLPSCFSQIAVNRVEPIATERILKYISRDTAFTRQDNKDTWLITYRDVLVGDGFLRGGPSVQEYRQEEQKVADHQHD